MIFKYLIIAKFLVKLNFEAKLQKVNNKKKIFSFVNTNSHIFNAF